MVTLDHCKNFMQFWDTCNRMFIKVRPAFSSGEEEVKKESLEWSLKPILMGMRLLGVDLTVSSVSVANSRWLNVYGLLCFVFNVFCNGTNCYRLAIVS